MVREASQLIITFVPEKANESCLLLEIDMDWQNGSMLAEARYRVKLSLDPNGTVWAKDENKFGKRMLEKMGWSKGKGLGAKEDGRQEHVKVSTKNNTRGLGCSAKQADYWIEHQDSFNELLQNLNKAGSASNSPAGSDSESGKVSSLENISKNSKARVHYQKFTKGKDLSSRSENDLACIFGFKGKKSKSKSKDNVVTPVETADTKKKSGGEEVDTSHGVVAIQRNLSVQEYFKLKMEQRKMNGSGGGGGVAGTRLSASASSSKSSSPEPSSFPQPDSAASVSAQTSTARSGAGRDSLDAESKKTEKSKKRKRKEAEEESCGQEELPSAEGDETGEGSTRKKRKKDKKRAVKEEYCESPDLEIHLISPSSPSNESRNKKKKKDKKKKMEIEICETLGGPCTESKKKKKNKKDKKREVEEDAYETPNPEVLPASPSDSANELKRKKRKKKSKRKQVGAVAEEVGASSEKKRKSVSFAEALVHLVTVDEIDDSMSAHCTESATKQEDTPDLKAAGKRKKKAKKEKLGKGKDLAVDDSADSDEGTEATEETEEASEEPASSRMTEMKKKGEKRRKSDSVANGGVGSDGCQNKEKAHRKLGKDSQATLSWKMAARSVEGYCNLRIKH